MTQPDPKAALARLRAAKDAALRKKLGQPLSLTDAALEQAAVVSDLDAEAAKAFWRAATLFLFRELLDAEPLEL